MALSQAALLCLALNVYHEARGEPLNGQKAVAAVTVNRAQTEKTKVCDEVFKPNQFSWTNKLYGSTSKKLQQALKIKREAKAWKIANDVARSALKDQKFKKLNLTHFHALHARPSWRRSKTIRYVMQIGGHRFYAARPETRNKDKS